MKTFSLEIITPDKIAYKDDVEQISIPAFNGEIGVLPGHIDYLAMLEPGEIRIKKNDELKLFAVSGGFAEIHPKNVVILCETADSAEEIDIERAELSKQRAKEKLKAKEKVDTAQIEAQIHIAAARLKVVSDLKKRKKKRIS
ncbi:MAG TPA: ATP synthase F1 subunit epsilon [Elusimicrobia bacterium]|nr:ATP synthase F1 subunit epsilon [Elusimicrobiota bacterium]